MNVPSGKNIQLIYLTFVLDVSNSAVLQLLQWISPPWKSVTAWRCKHLAGFWVASLPGEAGRTQAWFSAGTKHSAPGSAARGRKLWFAASDIPLSDPGVSTSSSTFVNCTINRTIQDVTMVMWYSMKEMLLVNCFHGKKRRTFWVSRACTTWLATLNKQKKKEEESDHWMQSCCFDPVIKSWPCLILHRPL